MPEPENAPQHEPEPKEGKQEKESVLIKFLRINKKFRIPFLFLLILFAAASIGGLAYLCWYMWLPNLWKWGFDPVSWRAIPSALGALYLLIIPFIPFASAYTVGDIVNLYLDEQGEVVRSQVSKLKRGQQNIEAELEKKDNAGLIPLIRYSRLELATYYGMGIDQTNRSFRYSIIAMWIGFIVIISGVTINFLPTSIREAFEVSSVREISIAGGTCHPRDKVNPFCIFKWTHLKVAGFKILRKSFTDYGVY